MRREKSRAVKLSTRLFRALLTLYPGEFRDEYGREVAMVFADRYRDARGIREHARLWVEAIAGVLREAPKEHVRMLLQDLRYAWRIARRSPAFTVTAVATLALGIGANTAIFQLIEAVAFRPLPVTRPHDLAEVRIVGGNKGFGVNPGRYTQLTRPMWQEIRDHQQAFSGAFAWAQVDLRIGEISNLQRVSGLVVTGAFFDVLGIRPVRGRLIEPADERVPCPPSKAVVSHDYWQRQLGGRDIEGGRLTIDGQPLEILGVVEPKFFGLAVGERFDLAVPFCEPKELRRELFNISVIGRLRPGWSIDRASAHFNALSAGIMDVTAPTGYSAQSIAGYREFRLAAYPVAQGVSGLRTTYGTSLRLLLALTGLVLLIACANLANLMLARASGRYREVAVRLALGASRTRLFRQFFAESALLAVLGAAGGLVIARVLSEALVWALDTPTSRIVLPLDVNWRVTAFSVAVATATCFVFGLAPAMRATKTRPAEVLRGGGRSMTDAGRFPVQRLMVVMQVAVSLVLLTAAVMFGRSFRNLATVDPRIRVDGVAILFIGYPALNGPPERLIEIQRQLLDEIRAVPGVVNAAATSNTPLTGSSWTHDVEIDGAKFSTKFTWVSPTYFETMAIPIVDGRGLSDLDTRASTPVAVVNRAFVRALGGTGSPLGKTMRTGPEPRFPSTVYQIVGVIPDTQYNDLKTPTPPMVFAPQTQHPALGPWANVMVHASSDPAGVARTVKQTFLQTHPEAAVEGLVFKDRVRDGMQRERLLAALAGFFGLLAAVLAMVGLYGMVSYAVAQRRQEIGIRVALGAARHDVVGMMMREASRLVVVGVVIGTGLALLAGPAATTLLFGLAPRDPITLAASAALMVLVASAASFLPARAAARLDPLEAIRDE
jgi:predicted permease